MGKTDRILSGGITRRRKIVILILLLIVIAAVFAQIIFRPDRKADLKVVVSGGVQGRLTYEKGRSLGYEGISSLKTGRNVLLLDAGDCLGGSESAETGEGLGVINIMNQAGYDAMVPGRLDFVYGTDALGKLRSQSHFPIIAANIKEASGRSYFEDYTIMNVDGVRIGLTGVTGALSSETAKSEDLTIEDPSRAVEEAIKKMGRNVDAVIVLANIYDDAELSQIASLDNVAAVIQPASDKASKKKKGSALIVSPGRYGSSAAVLDVNVTRDKASVKASFADTSDISEPEKESSTRQAVEKCLADMQDKASEKIGTIKISQEKTDAGLETEAVTEAETAAQTDESSGETSQSETKTAKAAVHNEETPTGDYVADAMVAAGSKYGVKAALIKDSDIKGTLRSGDVYRGDLNALFDDDLYMVVCRITGGQLRNILEDSFRDFPKAADFLQVSGLTFTYQSGTDIGSSVSDVTIDFRELQDAQTYTVALTSDIAKSFGLDSKNSGKTIPMMSMGNTLCSYVSGRGGSQSAEAETSAEGESSEDESERINIQ